MPGPDAHRYLVTIPSHVRMHTWLPVLDAYPMVLRVRADGDRQTWSTTVADPDAPGFLAAAQRLGITVEEIVGAGPHEAYELRVGEPGTGWTSGDDLDPVMVDLAALTAYMAGWTEPLELVTRLAAELGLPDPADDNAGVLDGQETTEEE